MRRLHIESLTLDENKLKETIATFELSAPIAEVTGSLGHIAKNVTTIRIHENYIGDKYVTWIKALGILDINLILDVSAQGQVWAVSRSFKEVQQQYRKSARKRLVEHFLNSQPGDLKQELETIKIKHDALLTQISDKDRVIRCLRTENGRLVRTRCELNKEVRKLKALIASLYKSLDSAMGDI